MNKNEHNTMLELVLCIFLGWMGAHRFYVKKYGTAILYLLTGGVFGIGWIIDAVSIILRMVKEKDIVLDPVHVATNSRPSVSSATPAKSPASEGKEKNPQIGKTYRVAGVNYYQDNILALACENSDFDMSKKELIDSCMTDEKIWKYEFFPENIELIPEPDNPHDPHAIKVVIDGEHVGYIKSGSCTHLLKVINGSGFSVLDCTIGGGPYKILYENDDGSYELDHDEYQYSVTLSLLEK